MEFWVAWNNCARKPPFFWMCHQFRCPGIVDDIETYLAESLSFALLFFKDMVVRLVLKAMRTQ